MTTSDKPVPEPGASFPGPACGALHEDGSRCTNTVHDGLTDWHFCSSNGRTWYAKRAADKPAPEPPIAVSTEEKIAGLRADLVETLTSEMGPRMARVAVFGPDISKEDAEAYSRATSPTAPPWPVGFRVNGIIRHLASLGIDLTVHAMCLDTSPNLIRLRELLQAAPEMEALLRDLMPMANQLAFGMEAGSGHPPEVIAEMHGRVERCKALLARLDKAAGR